MYNIAVKSIAFLFTCSYFDRTSCRDLCVACVTYIDVSVCYVYTMIVMIIPIIPEQKSGLNIMKILARAKMPYIPHTRYVVNAAAGLLEFT